jgi:endonuclease/exonuclease/phosphatase family metal-dependent hydrolase
MRRDLKLILSLVVLLALARALGIDGLTAQSRTNQLVVDSDPRGASEVTICSQNLNNYGLLPDVVKRTPGMSAERLAEKESALVKRFVKAGCDIVAVQEVLGRDEATSNNALTRLATKLHFSSNRSWAVVTGPSNDPMLRNGYVFAKDRAEMLSRLSYAQVELPKMIEQEKPRSFSRGPLEVQFAVKGQGEAAPKTVVIINFHLKSKRGGAGDPAQLEWETARMQMTEALRRIIANRHKASLASGEVPLILLGDRNSNFDSASAKILDGTLSLAMFQGDGVCRLSKRGVPLCQAGQAKPPNLFSVLTTDPQTKFLTGTHRYKKEYSWLDEILIATPALPAAWERFDSTGDYASGIVYDPREASDHALVWVRLNW